MVLRTTNPHLWVLLIRMSTHKPGTTNTRMMEPLRDVLHSIRSMPTWSMRTKVSRRSASGHPIGHPIYSRLSAGSDNQAQISSEAMTCTHVGSLLEPCDGRHLPKFHQKDAEHESIVQWHGRQKRSAVTNRPTARRTMGSDYPNFAAQRNSQWILEGHLIRIKTYSTRCCSFRATLIHGHCSEDVFERIYIPILQIEHHFASYNTSEKQRSLCLNEDPSAGSTEVNRSSLIVRLDGQCPSILNS